ncbi:PD-(D/E)XK nuclease-like domain-containing protein [Methylobacterium sp. D48H]
MKITPHLAGFVREPGIYRMPAAVYHADPCPEPSLSSSIARILIDQTERHAYAAHPRLGGDRDDQKDRRLDIGSVAHELLTGKGRGIHVIEALNKAGKPVENYATKAAQEERDDAIERGETPVLAGDLARSERMVSAIREKCRHTPGAERAFHEGEGELVLIWRDRIGVWGRAMLDWFDPETATVDDLKTTSAGLSDRMLATRIADGLDIQEAWYRRGLVHLMPELAGRVRFRFHFVETDEPHEARIVPLCGEQQYLGERRAVAAAVAFRECLRSDDWPGYADVIAPVEPARWAAERWEMRELSDPLFRRYGAQIVTALSPYAPAGEAA